MIVLKFFVENKIIYDNKVLSENTDFFENIYMKTPKIHNTIKTTIKMKANCIVSG